MLIVAMQHLYQWSASKCTFRSTNSEATPGSCCFFHAHGKRVVFAAPRLTARSSAEFTYCTSAALLLRTQSLLPTSSIAYCLISIPNILPTTLPFAQTGR